MKKDAILAIDQYQNLIEAFGKNSKEVKEFMASVRRFDSDEVTDEIYKRAMSKLRKEWQAPSLAARQQLSLNWRAVFGIISRSTIFVKSKFMKIFSCKNPKNFHKKAIDILTSSRYYNSVKRER